MPQFYKKKSVIISIIIGVLLIAAIAYSQRDKATEVDFVTVERKDLVQEVSVTGRVEPAEEVELAFERSGKVARVNVKVGDKVAAGQILVTLSNLDLVADLNRAHAGVESAKAQLLQYQAALENQEAKLAELKRGTRPEELRVYETKVENAKAALEDALKNMVDSARDAHTKADDAVRNRIDQFFEFPRSSSPQLKFNASQQAEIDLEAQRVDIERSLEAWQKSLVKLNLSNAAVYREQAEGYLGEVKFFLDLASLAVNNLTPTAVLTQTTIDGWKTDVSTARASINAAVSNLTAAEGKRRDAEAALAVAQNELILKQAGSASDAIAGQEAAVRQAEANVIYQEAQIKQAEASVLSANAQLGKTVIRAPFAGVITKQDAKVGAIAAANTPAVSLISAAVYEIEANVPEVDIAKLSIGNAARVTLDAYGRDAVFEVKVVAIDPAETVIDGVPTYKVTFQFSERDERVRSGMTANIDVLTERRDGVIVIPQRAVITRDGQKFVRVLQGEEVKEVEIKTGLRGSDGNIEIVSGVEEGEKVVVSFQ